MKLTKTQLNSLIENFISEQEDADTADADVEDKGETKEVVKKPKVEPFTITLGADNTGSGKEEKFEIKLFKDTDGKTNYKVNDNIVKKDTLSFVTIAGFGLHDKAASEDTKDVLSKIIKEKYPSFANYTIERLKQIVTQKNITSREPFSVNNLKDALMGKERSG
jgi:hypothetical protein